MRHLQFSICWATACGFLINSAPANGQGSLTPSGPPGPTMKTLAQIEPRAPVISLPFTITAPGSYYLTTNLTGASGQNGITISASDVSLDLNGFTLTGINNSLKGIEVSGPRRNLTIRNGTLSGWSGAIDAESASHCQFELLKAFDNGGNGLAAGANSVITSCSSYSNEGIGITADRESTIKDCIARANALNGIKAGTGSKVISCTASFNTSAGILVDHNSQVASCSALSNTSSGIVTGQGGQVNASSASNNGGPGISVSTNSIVSNCFASVNASSGITAGESCQISGTIASYNTLAGITAENDNNISNCSASNNQENGITAGANSQVIDSKAQNNIKIGISVGNGSTVRGCTTQRNVGDGILVTAECTVAGNNSNNNFNVRDSSGIHATGTDNNIKENNVTSNDRGIRADIAGNIIIKNTAANNTINYFLIGAQTLGPIFKGTNVVDAVNPWTNFEF